MPPRRAAALPLALAALLLLAAPPQTTAPPRAPVVALDGYVAAAAIRDTPIRVHAVRSRQRAGAPAERKPAGERPRTAQPRQQAPVTPAYGPHRPGLAAWLARAETRKIRRCESGGDYTLVDRGYFGAWQMDEDFVRTYAHVSAWQYVRAGRFMLSRAAQDAAAYAGYLARGYQPWACA